MTKSVLYSKESRDVLLSGVKKIVDAVRVTMGASGKCVLIGNAVYGNDGMVQLPTIVTKDGVSVANAFELSDPVENRGALLIKEAARKTVEQAGDATTLTCVLAEALISGGMKLIDEGANSQQLKKEMDAALEYVIAELKKMSIPVRGDLKRIKQVATVSANNDEEIGQLIADVYEKIGDDGIIDIDESTGVKTEVKLFDGYQLEGGWVSPFFVNNPAKETCEFLNPLVLIYQHKINHHTQFLQAVEIASQQNKPLVIICEDAEGEGLAALAMNNKSGAIRVCVIKSPFIGDLKRESMEDIALITGGTYLSEISGLDIKEVILEQLGTASKIVISKDETTIIGGAGNDVIRGTFISDLRETLKEAKSEEEKLPIEKRIARINGSIAVIRVGAATKTELSEKMDRVDDAVKATKAAIAEGFVAGGGTAFLRVIKKPSGIAIDIDAVPSQDFEKAEKVFNETGYLLYNYIEIGEKQSLGERLVFDALIKPLLQICENAGVDGLPILKSVLLQGGNNGYNVLSEKIEDMVESGIIDSTKALRCALTNAVSVAGMVLTSECSIITIH